MADDRGDARREVLIIAVCGAACVSVCVVVCVAVCGAACRGDVRREMLIIGDAMLVPPVTRFATLNECSPYAPACMKV